jgi:ankyrin repeat protein
MALRRNHLNLAKTLLRNGASTSQVYDSSGMTPLCRVVQHQLPNAVKLLLEFDAEVNEPDKFGIFPIHRATKLNLLEILELLVRHGARMNPRMPRIADMTPLHLSYDHLPTMMFLLENGANCYSTDRAGRNVRNLANYALLKLGDVPDHHRKSALKSCIQMFNLYPSYR